MAKKKYYAVRKGFTPGVYETWDEAKNQIDGFAGAEHKSFDSYAAAEAWIDGRDMAALEVDILLKEGFTVVYTDGSSNGNAYSYASLILTPEGKETVLSGRGNDAEALKTRNIAGELSAVMHALAWCKGQNIKEVVVFHDYEGCGAWAEGLWAPKSDVARKYVSYVSTCDLNVTFRKVSGHAGNSYNERVDKLARAALNS